MAVAPGLVQREGIIRFGTSAGTLQTVSNAVIKCRFMRRFETVSVPGTFGNSRVTQYPGNFEDMIEVDYLSQGTTVATILDGLISNAVFGATPSTVLYFDLVFADDTVGTSNQRITGTVSVMEAAKGGTVGSLRQETITFPVLTCTFANA